jgi:hypothetical protein
MQVTETERPQTAVPLDRYGVTRLPAHFGGFR